MEISSFVFKFNQWILLVFDILFQYKVVLHHFNKKSTQWLSESKVLLSFIRWQDREEKSLSRYSFFTFVRCLFFPFLSIWLTARWSKIDLFIHYQGIRLFAFSLLSYLMSNSTFISSLKARMNSSSMLRLMSSFYWINSEGNFIFRLFSFVETISSTQHTLLDFFLISPIFHS